MSLLFEVLEKFFVDGSTEVLDGVLAPLQYNGRVVIGKLASGLGVTKGRVFICHEQFIQESIEREGASHSNKVKVNPSHIDQLIEVPLVVGGDGAAMRKVGHNIELL